MTYPTRQHRPRQRHGGRRARALWPTFDRLLTLYGQRTLADFLRREAEGFRRRYPGMVVRPPPRAVLEQLYGRPPEFFTPERIQPYEPPEEDAG